MTFYENEHERKEWYNKYEQLEQSIGIRWLYSDMKPFIMEYIIELKGWKCRANAGKDTIIDILARQCLELEKRIIGLENRIDRLKNAT